jgi:hypothetical protein
VASRENDVRERRGVGQIALVVLDDERDAFDVKTVLGEVIFHVFERDQVCFEAFGLAVRDEHDAVSSLQDELTRRRVEQLPGDGVQVKASLEAADRRKTQREEVEEQRSFGLRFQRNQVPPRVGVRRPVNILDVRRLPREARAVIDDFKNDLASRVVDERHARLEAWATGSVQTGRPGVRLKTEEVVDILVRDLTEHVRVAFP